LEKIAKKLKCYICKDANRWFSSIVNCKKIDDARTVQIGEHCSDMEEMDLENCILGTDVGIMAIDDECPYMKNLRAN